MTEIKNLDETILAKLYDSIVHVRDDHTNLKEMVFKVKRIIKAATVMMTSLLLEEAMERIVHETCETLDCERATVFIYDSTKEELWSKAAKGSSTIIKVPIGKGIVGKY